MSSLKDKTVFIIGGTGGIGSDAVREFVRQGAAVCTTYLDEKEMKETAATLEPGACKFYLMDLREEDSISSAFTSVRKDFASIDVLVFAVTAPIKHGRIAAKSWDDVQGHMDVQVKGFFYIVKQLMDQMKQKKKVKFIVISTEYCIGKPPAGLSDYITAKYGLLGLSKCMAVELAQYGSTVNIISPGMVETPLLKGVPSIFKEMNAEQNPFGRIATPKDVTGAILFLASDTSDYLNGTNITVNGGGVML